MHLSLNAALVRIAIRLRVMRAARADTANNGLALAIVIAVGFEVLGVGEGAVHARGEEGRCTHCLLVASEGIGACVATIGILEGVSMHLREAL